MNNLYIWDVSEAYETRVFFAMAPDIETARGAVREKWRGGRAEGYNPASASSWETWKTERTYQQMLAEMETWLSQEPEIIRPMDAPKAFLIEHSG